jgi:hypothetical protein
MRLDDILQHAAHDRRHAGHYEHVAELKSRRLRYRVCDQRRAVRDARHAQTRFVQTVAAFVVRLQDGARVFADVDIHAKRSGDCVRCFVVVRWADAAGGENVIVLRRERVERSDDLIRYVGHDTRFGDLHAERRQEFCDRLKVHVLRSAGEQFVADQQDGGFDLALRHGRMIAALRWSVR